MKIAVGLSGGVDSAVAAYLLKQQGFDVLGITLQLKPGDSAEKEIADARLVAESIGIDIVVADERNYFKEAIIEYFKDEYINGRTPNPCIECNKLIKFGRMVEIAEEYGCEKIATGHYAIITEENGLFRLRRAESNKDQSYFLYKLDQNQLSKIVFPLSGLSKDQIREIADKAGIPVSKKKDSQEICFVPDDDYIKFLSSIGAKSEEGCFTDIDGNIIGKHSGILNYTVGQRKGLGAFGKPMFVVKINPENNTIMIGENGTQYFSGLVADRVCFVAGNPPAETFEANVKIRYRAQPVQAKIIVDNDLIRITFNEKQRSVTPGQSAVIYDDDGYVLGGAIIKESIF